MKESITTRVGRIISGSVNALVDAFENAAPEMVMEEAMREIDSADDSIKKVTYLADTRDIIFVQ